MRDATITAADIASARDIIITAGRDLALLAGADTTQTSQSRNQMFAGVTLKVSQNISTALQQLAAVPETFASGHGGNIYKAIAAASAVMQAVDAALQLSNPTVSASLMLGANGSRQSSTFSSSIARPTTLDAGGDILLMAGRDMRLQGTQAQAGGDFSLIAGRDLLIESAQSWTSADNKSSSWNAAAGVSGSLGILSSSYGVTIEGGGSQSRGKSGSITQLNANLRAGGTLNIVTGRDATIAGANLSARDIVLDIGRNLTIASRQDTAWSENSSSNAQVSVTFGLSSPMDSGSLSLGGSKGSSEKAWVTNQTSLTADRTLSIRTDAHTQIDGALLLSRSGDLTIDTATLGFSTLKDVDKGTQIGGQIGLGIAYGPDVDKKGNAISKPYFRAPSGTLQGEFSTYDRQQDTNATVGPGTITLRNPAAQAQDVATLNRDTTKAQVITKDTSAGTKVYVSSEAIKEIASGGEKIKTNLEALAAGRLAGLPEAVKGMVSGLSELAETLLPGEKYPIEQKAQIIALAAAIASGVIDPENLDPNCQQSSIDRGLFDWLVSPAYAATCKFTVTDNKGKTVTLAIDPTAFKDCLPLARAYLQTPEGIQRAAEVFKSVTSGDALNKVISVSQKEFGKLSDQDKALAAKWQALEGKQVGSTTECASLVQTLFPGIGRVATWTKGESVMDTRPPIGTAVATFNQWPDGGWNYGTPEAPNGAYGKSHTGIIAGYTEKGIILMHQFNNSDGARYEEIPWKTWSGGTAEAGNKYHVIKAKM